MTEARSSNNASIITTFQWKNKRNSPVLLTVL